MAKLEIALILRVTLVLLHARNSRCQESVGCYYQNGPLAGSTARNAVSLDWGLELCRNHTYMALGARSGDLVSWYCTDTLPSSRLHLWSCRDRCNGVLCGDLNRQRQTFYTVCPPGWYGSTSPYCDRPCHCDRPAVCRAFDGACQNGCQSRWTGKACDACADHWRGSDCDMCADGWHGDTCQEVDLDNIDTCSGSPPPCEQLCQNTEGSFNCSCYQGFNLTENQVNCTDIDECSDFPSPCEYECTNTLGGYQCSCPSGFNLSEANGTCSDSCRFDVYQSDWSGLRSLCAVVRATESLPLEQCMTEACRYTGNVVNFFPSGPLCDVRRCHRDTPDLKLSVGHTGWLVLVAASIDTPHGVHTAEQFVPVWVYVVVVVLGVCSLAGLLTVLVLCRRLNGGSRGATSGGQTPLAGLDRPGQHTPTQNGQATICGYVNSGAEIQTQDDIYEQIAMA